MLNEEFEHDITGYKKIDQYNDKLVDSISDMYKNILDDVGENPTREGLLKTPVRAAKAMQFLTQGYDLNPAEILRSAMFKEDYSQMVIVKDIEVYSLCEHHLLPFFGKAHIAYIPNGHIVGLSKLPRVVDAFARRLQVQERLTNEIRDCIQETLNPHGVAVVIECSHLCMQMRGIQKQNSATTTSAFTGEFLKDTTRKEFISLISTQSCINHSFPLMPDYSSVDENNIKHLDYRFDN
jgi:GTP cyclohydrolase I